jgi:putative toxin-antitoxin system antitoxin component (TIGR02293 family)
VWVKLGLPSSDLKLHDAIQIGFEPNVVKQFLKITQVDTGQLLKTTRLSQSTYSRRLKDNKLLTPVVSNSLARVIKVFNAAVDLHEGDTDAATRWFTSSVKGLGNRSPIELVSTEGGENAVLNLIGRLEHGVIT